MIIKNIIEKNIPLKKLNTIKLTISMNIILHNQHAIIKDANMIKIK